MVWLITGGLVFLLAGVALLVWQRRDVSRRITEFTAKHTFYEGEERPKVLVRELERGTEFVSVGASGEFRPPAGFVSMEATIEGIQDELSWLKRFGLTCLGVGLLLLFAGAVGSVLAH